MTRILLIAALLLAGCASKNYPLSLESLTTAFQKKAEDECQYETDRLEPKYTECLKAKGAYK